MATKSTSDSDQECMLSSDFRKVRYCSADRIGTSLGSPAPDPIETVKGKVYFMQK